MLDLHSDEATATLVAEAGEIRESITGAYALLLAFGGGIMAWLHLPNFVWQPFLFYALLACEGALAYSFRTSAPSVSRGVLVLAPIATLGWGTLLLQSWIPLTFLPLIVIAALVVAPTLGLAAAVIGLTASPT